MRSISSRRRLRNGTIRTSFRASLPSDGSVRIVNRSDTIGTLVVAGPRSRELSGHLTASDLSNAAFPWLAAQTIDILGNPTLVLRVNYVGSLDGRYTRRWSNFREFTMHWRQPGRITACRILASMQWIPCGSTNAIAAGSRTSRAATRRMRRLSIDSCLYKSPPLSAGTRSFARRSAAPAQRFVPLTLDDEGDADAPTCAPVLLRGENVGLVTSGGWSFTLNKSVALAYVRSDLATPGTKLEIEAFGKRRVATVRREPLYDPENVRLRLNNGPKSWRAVDRNSEVFDQPERIVDRRMRVSRSHGVADAEQLKSSVLVVNSRLGSAGDQIVIINRAKVR